MKIQNSVPSIGQTFFSIDLRNSSQSHWLVWLILDSCSIDRKQHLIDHKEFSINRDNEEFHHKVFAWINRFSIPLRSIKKEHSIDRKEFSIDWLKLAKLNFFRNFQVTIFYIFTIFHQKHFWFYKRRFIDQTLGVSRSRSRTLKC